VLFAIAAINIAGLRRGATRITGIKGRFLPAGLRNGTSPWLALPVGALFGFGFETASQIATYTLAFGTSGGLVGGLVVGAIFCAGMLLTDTLDSVVVHRLVSDRVSLTARTVQVWVWSVSLIALVVGTYELFQVLGWKSPFADIYVSVVIVTSLIAVFSFLLFATRRTSRLPLSATPVTEPTTR
jgi:high-affinity nickel-transport protein